MPIIILLTLLEHGAILIVLQLLWQRWMEDNNHREEDKDTQSHSTSHHSHLEKHQENTSDAWRKWSPGCKVRTFNEKCFIRITFLSFGYSIKTSSDPQSGVFITELIPNSVAHNSGLKVSSRLQTWRTIVTSLQYIYTTLDWRWDHRSEWAQCTEQASQGCHCNPPV